MKKSAEFQEKPAEKDPMDRFAKKPFCVGEVLLTNAEINGMPTKTAVEVTAVQFNGAVFVVKILNGPKHGTTLRIKASDLTK
jgi:hypothetical protein